MTSLFGLIIFSMALTGVEISRSAHVDNAASSSVLMWPLGEKLPVLSREGTSHGGTASQVGNGTMQKANLTDTEWRLTKIVDRPVQAVSGSKAYLRLLSNSQKVEGFTGCNGLQGRYEFGDQDVRFVGLATTRKLCAEIMEQERAFLNGLEKTRHWKVEGEHLVLMGGDHEAILLFEAHR
jgi:heat shock protein HslJ